MSFVSPSVESATISEVEITVTLELKCKLHDYDRTWKIIKCYHGKSTRPVTRRHKSENELIDQKIEMEEEAKKVALMACFKEQLGFTAFNDLVFDELYRPLKV